ncbi:MAG: Na+/melibiose symporter and related transporter [Tissierellia bacterium]|nr:MFS transporter [Bacillota bacterium]NLL23784.1 Na+/melibiose symporter and related transporter [Tissierellia bacterium]
MKKPLSKAIKRLYGLGDFGFGLMTQVETNLFVFFLTNVAKLSLPVVAIVGSVTSIVDAVLSPFYGAIISGTKPMKWGRNRSWMLIAPPLVVIPYILQFSSIGTEMTAATMICVGFIVSHIFWNIPWVANVSLIPVLANNPDEASFLSSRRATFTALAGIVFSFTGKPLAEFFAGVTGSLSLGYSILAGLMATVMVITYWTIFKITDGYEPTGKEAQQTAGGQRVTIGGMVKCLTQNPPLIMLLLSDFFRYMVTFVSMAAAAYYFTYVAQDTGRLFALYLLIGSLAQLVGAYIAAPVAKALSTRTASIVGLFGLAACAIVGKFFAMSVPMFFVFIIGMRIFLGILTSVMVALYADTSVYARWRTGENATPFVMGLMTVSLKAAVISRGTVIPFMLGLVGFVADTDPATATLALKNAVINMVLFIPGIFSLISGLILMLGYRLTREKVMEMQEEINAREAQASA